MKVLAENKKARFNYEVLEKFEAGMVLSGHEVKAAKLGRISLGGSYVILRNEEPFLLNANISPYQPKNTPKNYDPSRLRKLLLNKNEIKYLIGKSQQRGLTLVPLRMYTKGCKIKLEFGIARGRKRFNKKELIRKKDIEREIARSFKRL
jgi:SsrA-binding protein